MSRLQTLRFVLNDVFFLAMMAVIAAILTAAMVLQYAEGEIPCPLCLLERAAMLGVCFGIMQNIRHGFSDRNLGISLLFAVFLLIVAARQTLLDIYPRPGHDYVGSAVFGLHMPVWGVVIALALIAALALKLAIIGTEDGAKPAPRSSALGLIGTTLSLYVLAIAALNFGSVIVQCGVGQCHTEGYELLR